VSGASLYLKRVQEGKRIVSGTRGAINERAGGSAASLVGSVLQQIANDE
jgi:hypothetical protein